MDSRQSVLSKQCAIFIAHRQVCLLFGPSFQSDLHVHSFTQLVSGEILAPGTEVKDRNETSHHFKRSSDGLCSLLASSVLQRQTLIDFHSGEQSCSTDDTCIRPQAQGTAESAIHNLGESNPTSHPSEINSTTAAPRKQLQNHVPALRSQTSLPSSRLRRNLENAKAADAATAWHSFQIPAAPRNRVSSDLADLLTPSARNLAPVRGGCRPYSRGDTTQLRQRILDVDSCSERGTAQPRLDARFAVSTLGSRSFDEAQMLASSSINDPSPLVPALQPPLRRLRRAASGSSFPPAAAAADQARSAAPPGRGAAGFPERVVALTASPLSLRAAGQHTIPPFGSALASERLAAARTEPPPRTTTPPTPLPLCRSASPPHHGPDPHAAAAAPAEAAISVPDWARRASVGALRKALPAAGRRRTSAQGS